MLFHRATMIMLSGLAAFAAPALAQDAAEVQRAERLGAELVRLDKAILAAEAAGENLRAFRRDDRIAGWVATARGDGYLIRFVRSARDGELVARYQVPVSRSGQVLGEMERIEDLPLDLREVAQFRARQRAEATSHDTCSTSYETLVLPGDNGGWHAYLLPRGAFSDVLLLGGSYRADVSGDGNTVTGFGPLASGCAVLPNPEQDAALRFDDPAGGAINELHVYVGAQAGKPLYVTTGGRSWLVNEGRIQALAGSP